MLLARFGFFQCGPAPSAEMASGDSSAGGGPSALRNSESATPASFAGERMTARVFQKIFQFAAKYFPAG